MFLGLTLQFTICKINGCTISHQSFILSDTTQHQNRTRANTRLFNSNFQFKLSEHLLTILNMALQDI